DRLGGGGHVGAFGDDAAAIVDKGGGIGAVELVLRGRGQGDVTGHLPHGAARDELGASVTDLGIISDSSAAHLFDFLEHLEVEALVVDDKSLNLEVLQENQ